MLLLDSAHLQEEDARGPPLRLLAPREAALPLYPGRCQKALARITALPFGRTLEREGVNDHALTPVGHLLGACSVTLSSRHESLTFSGDVGREHDVLMPALEPPRRADVLLIRIDQR